LTLISSSFKIKDLQYQQWGLQHCHWCPY